MSNSTPPNSSLKNNILISIIIGLLTTLLWESIFADLFTFIFTHIQSFGLSLINNMIDNAYKDISDGYLNLSSDITLAMLVGILTGLITSILLSIIKTPFHQQVITENIPVHTIAKKGHHTRVKIIFFAFYILFFIFFWGIMGFISFKARTTVKTLNNIEIVSPYISDKEYKQLKSKFYSMQTQHDYQNLSKELNSIAINIL